MLVIAIDGPSGTGKSTIAQILAEKLGIYYLDTGAMYRAFTYLALQNAISLEEEKKLLELFSFFDYHLDKTKENTYRYFIGDQEVTTVIRSPEVTQSVSIVAQHPNIRKKMVEKQREMAASYSIVCEGRDIGTVVFPRAAVKIFLTASLETRASRRFLEMRAASSPFLGSYSQVKKEILLRDEMDSTRLCSPLKQAEDAILIDTTYLSLNDVVDRIEAYAKKAI